MNVERPSNCALESALAAAAIDPTKRPDFYRTLINSMLYVIDESPGPHHDGEHTLKAGTNLKIQNMVVDGIPHVPVFSSIERLRESVTGEARYVGVQARDLFGIIGRTHVWLNPRSKPSKQFTPLEIGALLDGSIFSPHSREVVAKERQIMLGQPAEYPTHITDALAKFFGMRKQVRAAYLAHCVDPASSTPPHTLIGIDASGDLDQLVGEASIVLQGICRKDDIVDLVRIDDSGISNYMTDQTKPFYKKKSLWPF